MSEPASYAVVVLTGGTSRRMGGGDKTALDLGAGRSVLDHLVSGLDTSVPLVVVGPSRPLERPVRWTRESPAGGGPLAGLAAGVAALAELTSPDGSDQPRPDWVVAVAGDQPFAAAAIPVLLDAVTPEVQAMVGVDAAGRRQPLLAAYRLCDLAAALDGPTAGGSMHSLLDRLTVATVQLPGRSLLDVDDPAGLAAARAALREDGPG